MRIALSLLLALAACGEYTDTAPDTDADTDADDDNLGLTCSLPGVPLTRSLTPQRTLPQLPTSNGWVSATYAVEAFGVHAQFTDGTTGTVDQRHALVTFTDHIPRQPSPSTWTRDLLWDAYFGLRVDGTGTWMNAMAESDVGYVPGTGIIRTVQHVGDLQVESFYFAPFQASATRDLVQIARVTNTGTTARTVSLYALENAHAGGEGTADGETLAFTGGAVSETRGGDALRSTPLGAVSHHGAAPAGDTRNPWSRLTGGLDLDDQVTSGADVAVGLQWDLGRLGPGVTETRGVVLSWDASGASALASRVDDWVAGRSAEVVLAAELDDWDAFHASETLPAGISADERAVALQSTAVLRMGQIRETGTGQGQILASLPPGGWNMSWPRDAAYAIVGLVHTGHQEMARDALDFQIHGDAGEYAAWLGLDDYLVSAARYYGDGAEESDGAWCPDGSDAGPNIELDNFGLFLWAYGEYAHAWPTDPWIASTLPAVLDGVADPLVRVIQPNGMLAADSSIWERHWEECFPNGRKQFSYSSIMAVSGLRYAEELSGDASYGTAAATLRRGLLGLAADGGPVLLYETDVGTCPMVASAPEETCGHCGPYDGSVIEIIDQGVVRPESALARGTLGALQGNLAMASGSPGFLRNDDGTGTTNPYPWYDDQEWVVIDLRMAVALDRVGEATGDPVLESNAEEIVDWITDQARVNYDLIGELLSDGLYTVEDEADHHNPGADGGGEIQGAVPMCGFGPGAYLLALEELSD